MKKCNVFCVILKIAAILGAAAAVFVVVKKLLDKITASKLAAVDEELDETCEGNCESCSFGCGDDEDEETAEETTETVENTDAE